MRKQSAGKGFKIEPLVLRILVLEERLVERESVDVDGNGSTGAPAVMLPMADITNV